MIETLQLFLITYFAALAGVIPPGLVNMTVAKSCVDKGKRSGVLVALGASIIVFIQALIAILMAKYIFTHPYVQKMMLRAGLVVFVIMGIYFFIEARKEKTKVEASKKSSAKSFLKGVMIASVNVFPIPYFVAISTAFNPDQGYGWLNITAFSFAAALGTFTTLYIYVISFLKIEKHTKSFSKYSNYFMAALMAILIIVTLVRIFADG
ncbi:LysE family transporter [Mesonia sp. MT50]|uniref:LysE family transporter n=1 Tax=Mesonia profundi TaxID=3070998 RepID=A0ABU0ZY63_9FLAO|nr:LysE family transporter [Mesonia profundi]MDQ7916255.1 LysE family transporter [Mesonia profundi]